MTKKPSDRNLMFFAFLMIALLACLVLFASCMTPRQVEAVSALQGLLADGVITQDQFERLASALSTATWLSDVVSIGSGLLGGTGAYVATNLRRNSLRKARGEPIAVPKATAPI